jgi:hypothetical protein
MPGFRPAPPLAGVVRFLAGEPVAPRRSDVVETILWLAAETGVGAAVARALTRNPSYLRNPHNRRNQRHRSPHHGRS